MASWRWYMGLNECLRLLVKHGKDGIQCVPSRWASRYFMSMLSSCCRRHLGSFFIAGQSLIQSLSRDPYSFGMDARVLQPISPTFTNDPDRDSSEVNTLPSICRYLTEVGRQRIPPNMLMSDIYKSTRQGGRECSVASGGRRKKTEGGHTPNFFFCTGPCTIKFY
jgi:hypothetical protein